MAAGLGFSGILGLSWGFLPVLWCSFRFGAGFQVSVGLVRPR